MSGKPAARLRVFVATIVVCLLAAATIYAVMNRQLLQDRIAAARFDISQPIEDLRRSLELTEDGERIFLASHPTLDGSQNFNTQCSAVTQSEAAHVLGCFADSRIHLFEVKDPRVSGIVKVTAAHELLHATYSRMKPGDRSVLSKNLRELYDERAATDPDLVERMSMYEGLPDAAFASELHSVFGSEVADVPDWLEDEYAHWFRHRATITDAFSSYQSVFSGLKQEAETLRDDMEILRADVEQRKLDYDEAVTQFNLDATYFAQRDVDREFAKDPTTRTLIKAGLEERKAELQLTLENLQADIDRYNEMRTDLESLGALSAELEGHLDSALAPISTRPE